MTEPFKLNLHFSHHAVKYQNAQLELHRFVYTNVYIYFILAGI